MKTFSLAWIISSLLLFAMSGLSYAQLDDLRVENFSGQRGLPKGIIEDILQDQEGFMWFSIKGGGLYRFDGHTATFFEHDPNDPVHSLPTNTINIIYEDRKGRLWAASALGLLQVDKRTGNTTLHRPDSALAIGAIFEDQQGILWLGTARGIGHFDPATKQFGLYPSPNGQYIGSLQQDDSGSFWALNYEGVYRFHPSTGDFVFFPIMTPEGKQSSLPMTVSIDPTGVVWISTYGDGLFRMDPRRPGQFVAYNPGGAVNKIAYEVYLADNYLWLTTSEGLQRINPRTNQVVNYFSTESQRRGLNSIAVHVAYHDRSGNLWLGTSNGVSKAAIHANPFYTYQVIPSPSTSYRKENAIHNVLEDHEGTVWVGHYAKGLCRFDRSTQHMTPVTVDPADSRHTVESMQWPLVEDRDGRLWVGSDTDKGLYLLDRKTDQFIRYDSKISVRVLAIAPSGTLWLGGDTGEVASFDPATKTFTYFSLVGTWLQALLVSRSGEVWVAAAQAGLIRLDPATGKFTRYTKVQAPEGHVNDLFVRSLYEDPEGIIWIGSAEGGLNRLDPDTNALTYFTTREGLPGNRINCIIGDERGNLWLGTSQGLCRFNIATHACRNFFESDGLPDNFFFTGSYSRHSGNLFFGTLNGLVIFHPDSIQETTNTFPVYVTSVKVQEKPVPLSLDKDIQLPYHENFLSFDFTAINYSAPDKTTYAYQLEGVDPDWVSSGNRRFANYTDLSPGSYTFRVKASIDNNVWSEAETKIKILIHPPWWQTWWAYGLYTLSGISVLFALIQYSVSRERLKNDLKLQRLEAEKMHEIDHLKSRFFANISHEFRTPLTLILGPLDKLLSRETNQDKPLYQTMQRNAKRLLALVNQLLDLSKLEAGNMRLENKPASIITFLKTIVLTFTSLAESKQIQFQLKYPTEDPVLYFDADKLEKIATNLLSNAFKFTPKGGEITVSAFLLRGEDHTPPPNVKKTDRTSTRILEIKVQDNGAGIPNDQLKKIFERFYQTDTTPTREHEGSGIGLALVRELVDLHEGEIAVESQPGAGACFTVRLPLLAADFEQLTIVEKTGEDDEPGARRRNDEEYQVDNLPASETEGAPLILIVEDNADIRYFIRESLHRDYRVMEAADGAAGYRLAVETIPDLILSDLMMPKMDGVELCRKLKQENKTDHIPIVMLTAKASVESKIEGLETGADDYIIKPFEGAELLARIKNLIEGRKKLRERFSREITLQPASIAITSMDEKLLQHVMQIMEEHMADPDFGVDAFCREAGMSRTQLHRKLKALTDQSTGDFIRIMRLKRAAGLLTNHAGSIAEVAFMVGFNDPSYFTKCFQKQFGRTPSEFVARNLVP